jgi:hypothetical protein
MKFYRYFNYNKGRVNKLTAIYSDNNYAIFCKNGKYYNTKNAAYIHNSAYKEFWLNDKYYGNQNDFTKESWRRFTKLQAFL